MTDVTQPVAEAINVTKEYQDATRRLKVLDDANIVIRPGEIVSIVGTSGAGKSTLLHLLGALDRPTHGEVKVGGRNLGTMTSAALAALRSKSIGFIFQFHHLLAECTALENVMAPGMIASRPLDELRAAASDLLEKLGLKDRLHHLPSQLSGGEQQRVALARALVNRPALVLADEPTGNLDAATADAVSSLLWNEVRQGGSSLVIVTHDADLAAKADRRLRLRAGKLEE